jgi:hypothetical protein
MPTFFGRELGPKAAKVGTWALLFLFAAGLLLLAMAGQDLVLIAVGAVLLLGAAAGFAGLKFR